MSFNISKVKVVASLFLLTGLLVFSLNIVAQKTINGLPQDYYEIKVYHFTSDDQENILDGYLKSAYLPALHNAGIKQVGVFKPLANDTAIDKRIYVFFASLSLEKLAGLPKLLQSDSTYIKAAKGYWDAAFDQPPFTRFETILSKSFYMAPQMKIPALTGSKSERIYELRSYEGPTEKLYNSKVKMFNEGGEIALFARLNFNAIFYSEVISGSRMPNLLYMTSFENMVERDAHWKSFFGDPAWKKLSSLAEYQHTVSKAEIILLHTTSYSDF